MNVTAHIVVPDAAEASDWYTNAFGARELSRIPLPSGKLMTVGDGADDQLPAAVAAMMSGCCSSATEFASCVRARSCSTT